MIRKRRFKVVVFVALIASCALSFCAVGIAKDLSSKIEQKRRQIAHKRGHERALTTDISRVSKRMHKLQGSISRLQSKQVRIETRLSRNKSELDRLQSQLKKEQARLKRLKKRLNEPQKMLAIRLIELYKADSPDAVTVVLEAKGFADLLERAEFMKRVSHQDQRIISRVRKARKESISIEKRLNGMESRQRQITHEIQNQHDEIARIKGTLVTRRDEYGAVKQKKSETLSNVREHRHDLEGDLKELEAQQAKIQATLRAASGSGSGALPAGPIKPGTGQLIWPVNGPVVSPFGPRWGRLHAGVDISVPNGTPIRAADSGTVVMLGWMGGYGNYTCVAHGSALSTCYAHQSSYSTSKGASVSKGQVIGISGCTGRCFGPHLHFETRINGTPVNPMGYL